ncbi:glycosyltransferase family 4 protein [Spiractinospora alimapuensis]|uniref:glycosyltransferase family 4 protein n=1 Tax=Spiractinospora alimapuensis TaxID=2820884 RepID=UPI001F189AC1|nr:glycosyltransferase family 4 protein [Spiractinospora alimapuensis]QVQ54849.1 glycosyltransferase family 4 protein [Spiractinospora alimapuensis]
MHRDTPARQSHKAPPRLDGVRVAVLNWRCPWQSVAGGAEEYAWRVSDDLARRGAQVTFHTSREPGQPRRESRAGIRIERRGGKFSVYPATLLRLLWRRRRVDAVIDCMNGVPFFAPLVLPRRTPVVCLVHHVHDLQFRAYFPDLLARLGQFVEGPIASRVYRRCRTVTVSESSRQALRTKLAWRSDITVIHNGAPAPHPVPEQRPAEDGTPGVLVLGRLVVQKRVTRIVDAVDALREDWPGLRLHVVGRGPQAAPLVERAERHDLADRVAMHGFLPEGEKRAVIASCRLHVTASEFEGWGLTVMEAAALGIPTVAYDVDGLRDSVRDGVTGWLVRDGETLPDVMGRALKELSDPVRAREIERECRAWAAQFTWERTGREMAGLLRDTL